MPANKKLKWQVPFLLVLIVGTVLILRKQAPYQTDQGLVFGTMYKITYQYKENLKEEIEAELQKVDNSLSPFNKNQLSLTSTTTRTTQSTVCLPVSSCCPNQSRQKHTEHLILRLLRW